MEARAAAGAVKFCGLRSTKDLDAVLQLPVSLIGLVWHGQSPRHICASVAVRLCAYLRERPPGSGVKQIPKIVLLAVDSLHRAKFSHLVDSVRPDYVQCHGQEDIASMVSFRNRHGVSLIKAVGVSSDADNINRLHLLESLKALQHHGITILLDYADCGAAVAKGGTGYSPDANSIRLLLPVLQRKPWILAGGLTPTNVCEKVRLLRPSGVDVSSGIEHRRGRKSPILMRQFAAALSGWASYSGAQSFP